MIFYAVTYNKPESEHEYADSDYELFDRLDHARQAFDKWCEHEPSLGSIQLIEFVPATAIEGWDQDFSFWDLPTTNYLRRWEFNEYKRPTPTIVQIPGYVWATYDEVDDRITELKFLPSLGYPGGTPPHVYQRAWDHPKGLDVVDNDSPFWKAMTVALGGGGETLIVPIGWEG